MSLRSSPSASANRSSSYATSTVVQQLFVNITESLLTADTASPLPSDGDESNSSLVRYRLLYRNYHGIISSFVCIFGLTYLLKMLFVLPAVIIFYCLPKSEMKSEPDPTSYFQVQFYMIHMLFTLTLHCISTWLTVFLAAFRYVFLSCKTLSVYVSSPDRALIGVSAVVILSTTLCIPSYVGHRIVKVYQNDTSSTPGTVKEIVYYRFEETAFSKSLALRETVFVLHSVMFKLIPCLLLLLFSFLLVQQLRFALRQSEKLHRHTSSSVGGSTSNGRIRGRRRENENRRTTLMLVSVCVLFLVTELPQGAILLLAFLSKSKSSHYFQIYQHLGDTFDILALINNSVNFLLYCLMSRAFRDTFKQTFCACESADPRASRSSSAQVINNKQLPLNASSASYNTLLTQKCSESYRASLSPILKTLSDNPPKSKKRKGFRHLKQSGSVVL